MAFSRFTKKHTIKSAIALTVGVSLLAACGAGETDTKSDGSKETKTEITVFAAASLNAAFPDIVNNVLHKENPNIDVKFSFDGSSSLAEQIKNGAPASVFASADENNMHKVDDFVIEPKKFTSNTLRLIVPAGNPAQITGLKDLDGKKFVMCASQVPCGKATKKLEEQLGFKLTPVSEEQNVTGVRTKVESGEADAGMVYFTDAKLSGKKVEVIDIPGTDKVRNFYMIAEIKKSQNSEAAKAFIKAVNSPEGKKIMEKYGFTDIK